MYLLRLPFLPDIWFFCLEISRSGKHEPFNYAYLGNMFLQEKVVGRLISLVRTESLEVRNAARDALLRINVCIYTLFFIFTFSQRPIHLFCCLTVSFVSWNLLSLYLMLTVNSIFIFLLVAGSFFHFGQVYWINFSTWWRKRTFKKDKEKWRSESWHVLQFWGDIWRKLCSFYSCFSSRYLVS